jgi:hypothetical protein
MPAPRFPLAAALVALLALAPPAAADPAGDSGVCTDQCTRDSNGNYESCHRLCMSERRLYDNSTQEPMRPMPRPPTLYGAIALDSRALITGAGKDYPTRADAERRAVAMCRRAGGSAAGCKVVVWGHNSCLALATSRTANGKGSSWGYAWSDDGWVSRRDATKACRKDGGADCRIAVSLCTG